MRARLFPRSKQRPDGRSAAVVVARVFMAGMSGGVGGATAGGAREESQPLRRLRSLECILDPSLVSSGARFVCLGVHRVVGGRKVGNKGSGLKGLSCFHPFHNRALKTGWCFQAGVELAPPPPPCPTPCAARAARRSTAGARPTAVSVPPRNPRWPPRRRAGTLAARRRASAAPCRQSCLDLVFGSARA